MLTRWDPFAELDRLTRAHRVRAPRPTFWPAVDIVEEDDAIAMTVEVAGMKAEDIKVHVEHNVLTLSGERRVEREDAEERYHRIERAYGSFQRAFVLPKNVDGEGSDASLDDGLLRLRLPKRPAAERRQIAVRGGSTAAGLEAATA